MSRVRGPLSPIRPGVIIRDALLRLGDSPINGVYKEYKNYVTALNESTSIEKWRPPMSYHSFLRYVALLTAQGLIVKLRDEPMLFPPADPNPLLGLKDHTAPQVIEARRVIIKLSPEGIAREYAFENPWKGSAATTVAPRQSRPSIPRELVEITEEAMQAPTPRKERKEHTVRDERRKTLARAVSELESRKRELVEQADRLAQAGSTPQEFEDYRSRVESFNLDVQAAFGRPMFPLLTEDMERMTACANLLRQAPNLPARKLQALSSCRVSVGILRDRLLATDLQQVRP